MRHNRREENEMEYFGISLPSLIGPVASTVAATGTELLPVPARVCATFEAGEERGGWTPPYIVIYPQPGTPAPGSDAWSASWDGPLVAALRDDGLHVHAVVGYLTEPAEVDSGVVTVLVVFDGDPETDDFTGWDDVKSISVQRLELSPRWDAATLNHFAECRQALGHAAAPVFGSIDLDVGLNEYLRAQATLAIDDHDVGPVVVMPQRDGRLVHRTRLIEIWVEPVPDPSVDGDGKVVLDGQLGRRWRAELDSAQRVNAKSPAGGPLPEGLTGEALWRATAAELVRRPGHGGARRLEAYARLGAKLGYARILDQAVLAQAVLDADSAETDALGPVAADALGALRHAIEARRSDRIPA